MAGEADTIVVLRAAVSDLHDAVTNVRDLHKSWNMPSVLTPPPPNPSSVSGWNFDTFEKYINQRFVDLSMQLRERYEAQQTGVTAALAAAEKAVNAALIAAEKAVDKAEGAQQLRNEAQNEFRQALGDLSKLMWTREEGTSSVGALGRELGITIKANVDKVNTLEAGYANLQGKIWAVSALFAIGALGVISSLHRKMVRVRNGYQSLSPLPAGFRGPKPAGLYSAYFGSRT